MNNFFKIQTDMTVTNVLPIHYIEKLVSLNATEKLFTFGKFSLVTCVISSVLDSAENGENVSY